MTATTDLDLAAFLLAKGHEVTISALGNGRHAFSFPPAAEVDVLAYRQGAPMSARLYAGAMHDLRAIVHTPRGATQRARAEEESRGNR